MRDVILKIERDLSDSIYNTCISGARSSWTTLYSLCKRYSEMADLEESHFRGSVAKDVVFADLEWDRNSSGSRLLGMERLMERFRRLIFNFEEDFKPRLSYEYFADEEKKKKTQVSVLSPLAECAYKKEGHQAFKAMLKYTGDVEVYGQSLDSPFPPCRYFFF